MNKRPTTLDPAPSRIRILSMDGGGIYGLASAIWLRRLCAAQTRFLAGMDVHLFAGTSSGAINSLLLARHKQPRDAILSGDLERFWQDPRPFQNSNPFLAPLSFFGLTGWFSGDDFMAHLKDTFGDLRLGDLPQEVLISTFNWRGSEKPLATRAGQEQRHWRPKFFSNTMADDADSNVRVAEIAYAAAAPPNLRPIYGGFGDGASFSASPVVEAVALVVRHVVLESVQGNERLRVLRDWPSVEKGVATRNVGPLLDRVAVLSLGSGQQLPALGGTGDVNLGFSFSQLATDPERGDFWPTSAYSLDASTEAAEFVVKQLVGRDRAMRLNPGVLHVPTVMAALMARFPLWWQWLLTHIHEGAGGNASQSAILATLDFLRTPHSWDINDALSDQRWTPQRRHSEIELYSRPAMAGLRDVLMLAFIDEDGEVMVSTSSTEGDSWETPHPLIPQKPMRDIGDLTAGAGFYSPLDDQEPRALGAASHQNQFWLAEPVMGQVHLWSSADAKHWTLNATIETPHIAGHPALASDGKRLIVVYRAEKRVFVSVLEEGTSGWTAPLALQGFSFGGCPALAGGSKGFTMAYRGPEERMVWTSTSQNGIEWGAPFELSGHVIVDESPALTYSENTGIWRMAWRREAWPPNIWVANSHNGMVWTTPIKLNDRATNNSPALAISNNVPCMAWRGAENDRNLWTSILPHRTTEPERVAT